ncbi:MAG: DMT family transporter [Paracoccaceae bacterium]
MAPAEPRTAMTTPIDRPLAAALFIAGYAVIIGFTDNFVRIIAGEIGVWQFHLMRSVIAGALLLAAALPLGLRLRPVHLGAVAARSMLHGAAVIIYFGALAFLPVAVVAAGLFTAPIFVLLISGVVYRHPISALQIIAVVLGFAGVVLVLGPQAMAGASVAALLPIVAGALYAVGNIATREWCGEERAETLVAGFFAALAVIGLGALAVLAIVPVDVPVGAAGFVLRGAAWAGAEVWFWVFIQAAGSLVAIACMVRGYQVTTAARASVYEYVILPAAAMWSFLLWDERLGVIALSGMGLIVAAGALMAAKGR